jgi:transposase-like protein
MRSKKSMSTKLPSEFYDWVLLPEDRIQCPECGKGDKIYAIYSGGTPKYGCDWCGKVFTRPEKRFKRVTKAMSTNLPSEFYGGTLMPKNRIFCPRCGKGDKIHVIYGGDNPRYGCDWCGKIFV